MTFDQNETRTDFNKNDKQIYFNRVRGEITEINLSEIWCSLTLKVGHENSRLVNLTFKKDQQEKLLGNKIVGDKVGVRYFLTSRFKNNRWHTTANVLSIDSND
jgi:hypothetical protein